MKDSLLVVPAGIFLGLIGAEKDRMASSPLAVAALELLISGLVAVTDPIGTDFYPLAKPG